MFLYEKEEDQPHTKYQSNGVPQNENQSPLFSITQNKNTHSHSPTKKKPYSGLEVSDQIQEYNIPLSSNNSSPYRKPRRSGQKHSINFRQTEQIKKVEVTLEEIQQLENIVKTDRNTDIDFYEPGQRNLSKFDSDLPILDKIDAKFKVQEAKEPETELENLKIPEEPITSEIPQKNNQDNIQIEKSPVNVVRFSDESEDEQEEEKEDQKKQNKKQNNIIEENQDIQKFSSDEDIEPIQNIKKSTSSTGVIADNDQNSDNSEQEEEDEQQQQNKNIVPLRKPKNGPKILTQQILKLDCDDKLREFLLSPIVRGHVLQCHVKREQNGLNWFTPKFHLYWDDGNYLLMSAKKMGGNKAPNFLILSQNMSNVEKSDDFSKLNERYIGKLKGEFMGNSYHIYDTGLNKDRFKTDNTNLIRQELGYVEFQHSTSTSDILTKTVVLLPEINPVTHDQLQEFQNMSKEDSLQHKFRSNDLTNIKKFTSKQPLYNTKDKTYYLDFGPRVEKQSIKNYQLVDDIDDEVIYFTSGRTKQDNTFVMDVQFPFSPLQAFAIMIAGLTYKP